MTTALIVDDDQEILALLEERLLSMGHECRKAQSQTEAEEILEDHVFDYILLDLEIPNRFQGRADIVYGHNLLRKIRSDAGSQPHAGHCHHRSRIEEPSSLRGNYEARRH